MEIILREQWEAFLYGADEEAIAQTDEIATKEAFAHDVSAAIKKVYPDAIITVEFDTDGPAKEITDVGNEEYYDVLATISEIGEEVFNAGVFWL